MSAQSIPLLQIAPVFIVGGIGVWLAFGGSSRKAVARREPSVPGLLDDTVLGFLGRTVPLVAAIVALTIVWRWSAGDDDLLHGLYDRTPVGLKIYAGAALAYLGRDIWRMRGRIGDAIRGRASIADLRDAYRASARRAG